MKKIALTAAALLVATGAAFADSGSFQQPVNTNHGTASATNVDNMPTGSINKLFTASGDHANTNTSVPSDPSQRFWGR